MNKKIKYFYINLDVDLDRRKHVENQFAVHNIKCERFSAGKKGNNKIDRSKSCRDNHLKLWKRIKKDEIYIIFEDDINIIKNQFEEIINNIKDKNWCAINFCLPARGINGYNVDNGFKRALKTVGLPGVNTGSQCIAINGENVNQLLNIFKNKAENSPYFDVQLKTNFDKIHYYWHDQSIVTHNHSIKSTINHD